MKDKQKEAFVSRKDVLRDLTCSRSSRPSDTVIVVVTPLVSIMKDQVFDLDGRKRAAIHVTSIAQKNKRASSFNLMHSFVTWADPFSLFTLQEAGPRD